ncbi:MAG: twin-arginine translocase TatA/TatE family subunit [Chloroflexota bacterium]
MPFNIGPMELIIVLVVILIIFGVGRLPEVGGAIGKGLREFRKAQSWEDENPPSKETEAEPKPEEDKKS